VLLRVAPGTRGAGFATIQDALDHAAAHSDGVTPYRISVAAGTYRENLTLRTPRVTLESAPGGEVVVQPPAGRTTNPQVLIGAGRVTLRGLTVDGLYEDPERVKYNVYVHLAGDRDGVTIEGCRFRRTQVGLLVKAATDPAEYNEDVVVRGNLFESSHTGIRVDATGLGENRGRIDFTSRANRMVLRNVAHDENIVAIVVRRLDPVSRFRSVDDEFDLESSHTAGRGDVQAYMFHDWMPELSEIVSPRIRIAHDGRGNRQQDLFAVKIHGTLLTLPARPHVVLCSDLRLEVLDRTRRNVGGTANVAYNGADKVVVLVAGGTVDAELSAAGGMTMRTFAVDPNVRAPFGIYHVGVPVEGVQHVGGSSAAIEPLSRDSFVTPHGGLPRTSSPLAPWLGVDDAEGSRRLCVEFGGAVHCTPELPCEDCTSASIPAAFQSPRRGVSR
jgi:hypothetical protein